VQREVSGPGGGAFVEFNPRDRLSVNGSAPPSLPLRYWADLGTVSPPDRLVRRLLGTGSLAVIYGEPGCGKTFLATDLGLHIALGRAWFGRAVTPGAVIYVAGEGVAGINNRLAGFKAKHEPDGDVAFAIVPVAIDLGPGGTDTDRVIAATAAVEARTGKAVLLIVVDTLARSMGAGDENSTQDMGRFVASCDRIRLGTGATILVVHHRGKSSQAGARGSSALLGAADTVLEVEKLEGGRVARVVKQKDAVDGVEIGFELEVVELGEDDEGEPITTCVVRQTDEVAKAAPKLTATEKRAMAVLHNVLVDFGESLGNSVTFPSVTLVKIDRFRQALKSAGVTDRDKPENERSQWRRITTNLANKGVFAMRDDYCWACDKP
jgi:AAA domain